MNTRSKRMRDAGFLPRKRGWIKDSDFDDTPKPVAWLRRSDLEELMKCNYMSIGADSPAIWAPYDISSPPPEMNLIPVYSSRIEAGNFELTDDEIDAIIDSMTHTPYGIGSRKEDAMEFAKAIIYALVMKNS